MEYLSNDYEDRLNQPVLSLNKYVHALLSHTQIYKITLCSRDKFS